MSARRDDTLQVFIDESLEHLADIENDLLAIEAAGADIDEERVNKVFRAAHSIKGGAGFMNLGNIKELAHRMENVLGMVRSRKIVPNPENINILLLAADALRGLIENVEASDETDVSEYIEGLNGIAAGVSHGEFDVAGEPGGEPALAGSADERLPEDSSVEPPQGKPAEEPDTEFIEPPEPEISPALNIDLEDIVRARDAGLFVYLIAVDSGTRKPQQALLEELRLNGEILASTVDADNVPEAQLLDDDSQQVLFACVLDPEDLLSLLEIGADQLFAVDEELLLRPVAQAAMSGAEPRQEEPADSLVAEPSSAESAPPPTPADEERFPEEPSPAAALEEPPPLPADATLPGEKPDRDSPLAPPDSSASGGSARASAATSLRVHVDLLDDLMNLAGELVLGRNQLLQAITSGDSRSLGRVGQRIDYITSELQETIVLTRLQPVGNIFGKFPRVVRDMSQQLDKLVDLAIEGEDVELDKTLIEAIDDPLTHLVRNAIDHGIEKPDERLRAGKSSVGRILLKAYHGEGRVNIEVVDDGRGLDPDRLAAAAVAKGFVPEDRVRSMSDKEKVGLIFLPGFSVREQVTELSGRGVGMDVVKTNIDRLGGQIDIDSRPGQGAAILIQLPLTLAIIPSQIVLDAGERYAIPQVNLRELLRISAAKIKEEVEIVGDIEVVRRRGHLLPLVRLADVIGTQRMYRDARTGEPRTDRRQNLADRRSRKTEWPDDSRSDADSREQEPRSQGDRRSQVTSALNIAVVVAGGMRYGLVVDRLLDAEEIVVKPLGRHLKSCRAYAGATIMGDGRVALILDTDNLARLADLSMVGTTAEEAEEQEAAKAAEARRNLQSLLIFRGGANEQFAVPLHQVARIEKIGVGDIEEVGDKRVIQHRGSSLVVFSIDQVAHVKPLAPERGLLVIVFSAAHREIGLLATGPVEAVDVSVEIDETTLKQPGIAGSAIIKGRTSLLVDLYQAVRILNPEWFPEGGVQEPAPQKPHTILVVEDSAFFRSQVEECVRDEGYDVIAAEDGADAWQQLQESGDQVSLVVTDIEMPNLDGCELTRRIKADERYAHLPVIGLSALAGDDDLARGEEAGIDEYQIKLDKEQLLESIGRYIEDTSP